MHISAMLYRCLSILLLLTYDVVCAKQGDDQSVTHGDYQSGKPKKDYSLYLGVLIPWSDEWEVGQYMGAAVGIGIREIARRQLLPGIDIQWDWADTRCKSLIGLKAALDLHSRFGHVDAYIGDGCSVVCMPVALVSAAWNIPQISWGCNSGDLSRKYDYPTFTRSVGTWPSLAPMFDKFASLFNWNRIGIVATTEPVVQLTMNAIKMACENNNKTIITRTVESTVEGSDTVPAMLAKLRLVVREMKTQTHVFIVLMYDNDLRNFLLSALDEGMMNGRYAFISIDADISKVQSDYRTEEVKFVYEGLLSSNLRVPSGPEWEQFAKQVIEEFQIEPKFEGFPKLYANASVDEVDAHAGTLHDALLMWAYGVNKTLQQGGRIDDGLNITRNILNLTFKGITGKVAINEDGDRKPDYTISIIQKGRYMPLLDWFAAEDTFVKVYKGGFAPEDWRGVRWSGGVTTPPIGRPNCGWDGEYCQISVTEKAGRWVTIWVPVITGVVLLIFITVAAILYKKMKFEAQLKSSLWKISWHEIQRHKPRRHGSISASRVFERGSFINSRMSMRSCRSMSSTTSYDRQLFTDVGQYKGKIVAIKHVDKLTVNYQDRGILLELKMMRGIIHDNINQFIGACVEPHHICVIMAYAQKGSLQDVIHNEAISLTWDFKLSIATDIATGMCYLHRTALGSHGHLTSANCVIDSRWTCKVTDYGLALFKSTGSSRRQSYVERHPSAALWTSPELLRMVSPPVYGTQKGDIYSYGIILQEIVLEEVPYCDNTPPLEVDEIVEAVKRGVEPYYRPYVPKTSCSATWRNIMQACWLEDPDDRPTFSKIRQQLRNLNGGRSMNVIDNMINMLEKHAERLEDLVADRTEELQVEKKKVENLLYNILPRSVADELKQGRHVEPESFDSVTIYFSDIVGFTTLAANSTPLQVVDLLNNLYSTFDQVTDQYDVYKVETIGDAYMVVSGLPVRNNNNHIVEIATMSLHLLSSINSFTIPHLPDTQLQLRIGLHSGPCVAGVVGTKMPRYCLFGDTVNTASRMESTGEALKIHMSEASAALLARIGGFQMECRGQTYVKGKGDMVTFWLLGRDDYEFKLPSIESQQFSRSGSPAQGFSPHIKRSYSHHVTRRTSNSPLKKRPQSTQPPATKPLQSGSYVFSSVPYQKTVHNEGNPSLAETHTASLSEKQETPQVEWESLNNPIQTDNTTKQDICIKDLSTVSEDYVKFFLPDNEGEKIKIQYIPSIATSNSTTTLTCDFSPEHTSFPLLDLKSLTFQNENTQHPNGHLPLDKE